MKLRLICFTFFFVCRRFTVIGQTVDSKENDGASTETLVAPGTPEGQLSLVHRLEIMEDAFRAIVSALSNQSNELFAPIKEILVQHPSVRSFLSSTPFLTNATTVPVRGIDKNETVESSTRETKDIFQQGEHIVDNLKGVVKCSLAHLVDINTVDDLNSSLNGSALTAFFASNESLEINWPMPSDECLKFSTGIWIRVYQSGDEYKWPAETLLAVPQKCIKKSSNISYSIVLSPPSPSAAEKEDPCNFYLTKNLIQCRSYVIEVIPNYQSLRGKTLRIETVIPPKISADGSMKSLLTAVANGDVLKLNWEDNSGCKPQMTSLNLKIFQDGFVDIQRQNVSNIRIPRSCLRQHVNNDNLFTMVLPANPQTCPIDWKPLDKCRKYRLEISPKYTDTWNGPSTSLDILAKGQEAANSSFASNDIIWRCPRKHFFCDHRCWSSDTPYICDGRNHCTNGRDEHYCDPVCKDGFKCGRQCIPNELVCNGKFDCFDGSDEDYTCSYGNMCQQFTNSSGNFSSLIIPKPANEIHSDRMSDVVRKTTVLISVEPTHQIWLTFEKYLTFENMHFVKIYDGPYSTSPLLFSRGGSQNQFSVRSSSNELYVEFPSYHDVQYGITALYASINATSEPFVPGCGGYIRGEGVISTPTYSANPEITDCFWFLETKNSEDTLALSNSDFVLYQRRKSISTTARSSVFGHLPVTVPPPAESPPLIIYDGWSTEGLVLYNGEAEDQQRAVTYSISNRMMVHLPSPEIREEPPFSWTVSRISTPQCNHTFDGSSGIIKSPNYPVVYSHLSDCRWTIELKPGLKIRLLFAFFETQDQADFLYVYDGPTIYSKLLLEKSGSVRTPFEITSTSNQMMIRFITDASIALPGFLVVYSTV
ncbi:uncharacterized protein LOC130685734 [Daphnia carinata]|uniref:uncharacterized protein LOC130685734 n=1 Tax=Daphnia carinata TaxID=120202 RepID=UPI00257FF195|nr:uncharacterized protein LOC130685734 [Daphnia carinata]